MILITNSNVWIYFKTNFILCSTTVEAATAITFNSASSDNPPFIVGGMLVACVFAVFGVLMVIF